MARIAIIGGGVSGLVCGWLLHPEHEITLFEANAYLGGHTNTIACDRADGTWNVDTGFIVYNERNYPNFTRLLAQLGVPTQPSDMSFGVRCDRTGLEYCGTSLNTMFAQRRNLVKPAFYGLIREILRFNKHAVKILDEVPNQSELTLRDFIRLGGYSDLFVDKYLIPMGAAIWSTPPQQMQEFPARYFVRFFQHHGLLSIVDRPIWRVIQGGSWNYVRALTKDFQHRTRLKCPVREVRRFADHVELTPLDGQKLLFDQVIFATHSDQTLKMLSDATPQETDILSRMTYQRNEAILHTDCGIMPRRSRAWASWNYRIDAHAGDAATLTYDMNRLQSLASADRFLVTLNSADHLAGEKILRRIEYHHPVYSVAGVAAQKRHSEISGIARTHFCGAYWGSGFHEDGVNSALAVGKAFGVGLH